MEGHFTGCFVAAIGRPQFECDTLGRTRVRVFGDNAVNPLILGSLHIHHGEVLHVDLRLHQFDIFRRFNLQANFLWRWSVSDGPADNLGCDGGPVWNHCREEETVGFFIRGNGDTLALNAVPAPKLEDSLDFPAFARRIFTLGQLRDRAPTGRLQLCDDNRLVTRVGEAIERRGLLVHESCLNFHLAGLKNELAGIEAANGKE